MKTVCLFLFFSGAALFAYAQDVPALYSAVSSSVVYLQHEVFLNSADCTKPDLWKRFEKFTKSSFLDVTVPLISGSGFFVDSDGTILTNRHVAKVDLHEARLQAILSFDKIIDENFRSNFSTGERTDIEKDFEAMISKGRHSFSATLGTRKLGEVTVLSVANDDEPDLALVKVGGAPFHGIKLAGSNIVGPDLVGTDVLSFGYPLGSELDVLLKERTVTMNRGMISAFRRTELSLQHSAAISYGNSGGPLLNSEGLVLGVNTAGLQEQQGNSLFYAIDIGEVRDFLNKKGFGNLLLWNQRLPSIAKTNSNQKLNVLGEIECSADVVLDIDKNVDVFLDGSKIGVGPLFLHLVNPVSPLELHGPTGDFSAKLRLLSTLSGSTTIRPTLAPRSVPVKINSNPIGATVVVDGKDLGKTPLNITLTEDRYAIQLRQAGQWYEDTMADIHADQTNEVDFRGQIGYPITLNNLPPDAGITLRFTSKLGKSTFKGSEKVNLPTGDWNLSIDGSDAFSGVPVSVQVQQEPVTLDLAPLRKAAALPLPKAIIQIDGKFDDWENIPPIIVSSQNTTDNKTIRRVFMAEDTENLYVRLDIADVTPSSFLHVHNFNEIPGDSFYAINIDNGDSQNNVILRVVHWDHSWGGRLGWYVELCHREKGTVHHPYGSLPRLLPSIGQYAMQGSSLEISFPLTKLRKALSDPGPAGKYRVFGWTGKGWDDISDSRQTDVGYFSFQELN